MAEPFISRKNLIVFSAMIFVTGILAYLAVLFLMLRHERNTARTRADAAPRIYSFPSMVISLFDRPGAGQAKLSGHLKFRVSLELVNRKAGEAVEASRIQLEDAINQYLTGKSVSEVFDVNPDLQEKKKEKIRSELQGILNKILRENFVQSVYFPEYFVL